MGFRVFGAFAPGLLQSGGLKCSELEGREGFTARGFMGLRIYLGLGFKVYLYQVTTGFRS